MRISVSCPQGHKLQIAEKYAGKKIACPKCKEVVKVPGVSPPDPLPAEGKKPAVAIPRPKDAGQPAPLPRSEATPTKTEADNKLKRSAKIEPSDEYGRASESDSDDTFQSEYSDYEDAGELSENDPYGHYESDETSPKSLPPRRGDIKKRPETQPPKPTSEVPGNSRERIRIMALGAGTGAAIAAVALIAVWMVRQGSNSIERQSGTVASTDTAPGGDVTSSTSESTLASVSTIDLQEKLRRIALAVLSFHDVHGWLSPSLDDGSAEAASLKPKTPDPLARRATKLSWRVHVLPFLGEEQLYNQFNLDESWDSENNIQLMSRTPLPFRTDDVNDGMTRIRAFTSKGMLLGTLRHSNLASVSDGMSSTILCLAAGPDKAVPWSKPDEMLLDVDSPKSALGQLPGGLIPAVMVSGVPFLIGSDIPDADFVALLTPGAGDSVDVSKYAELSKDLMDRSRSENTARKLTGATSKAAASHWYAAATGRPWQRFGGRDSPEAEADRHRIRNYGIGA